MAKAASKRKAANGYKLADRLPKGEILEDVNKKKWKLGTPIGQGGFGEIYAAQDANSTGSNYPYVIKIEPHTNGPLFVEMHFYVRNAKPADLEEFKKEKGLKTLGMPLYLGSGSYEHKNEKYRFVVMEKFGTDLWKLFLENNKVFPTDTVFKLAVQMLDVLEYIHGRGYVHADIKGANILMGTMKGTTNQAYLVDFGLATKFTTEKEFKPNPKKAHDGTIEYLSRDAHKGVQTRRGDLEILAYNLIQWLGCTLPWENNLKTPSTVHNSKEEYMSDVPKMIKACFGHKTPPGAIVDYLNYLKSLNFNTEPDYKKIRKIFISGIKDAKGTESGPLIFSAKKSPLKRKSDTKTNSSPKRKVGRPRKLQKQTEKDTENSEPDCNDEETLDDQKNSPSDVDDEDVIDSSYKEEVKVEKKGPKAKANKLPKKATRQKTTKKNEEEEDVETNDTMNELNENKTESLNNDEDKEENGTVDPCEGYNEAMKEVMSKKLRNGKSKAEKDTKHITGEDDMEGYTESMKEIMLKKKERLASKKPVKAKKVAAASTSTKNDIPETSRGSRLRARKEVCYDEIDSD